MKISLVLALARYPARLGVEDIPSRTGFSLRSS